MPQARIQPPFNPLDLSTPTLLTAHILLLSRLCTDPLHRVVHRLLGHTVKDVHVDAVLLKVRIVKQGLCTRW